MATTNGWSFMLSHFTDYAFIFILFFRELLWSWKVVENEKGGEGFSNIEVELHIQRRTVIKDM
jgi:hypothetical protein